MAKRRWRAVRTHYLKQLGRPRRRKLEDVSILLYKPTEHLVRDTFHPKFLSDWRPMSRRLAKKTSQVIQLEDFSLARNPQGTLEQLTEIARAAALHPDLRINFADHACDDITPYIVLAHLTRGLPPIISGGRITREVSDIVDAVGMRSSLGIGSVKRRRQQISFVSAFPLISRTPPGTFGDRDHLLRPQLKEKVADRFCDTLNDWLLEHDLELGDEGQAAFVRTITEALDNAERHADPQYVESEGDWSIAAFSKLEFVDDAFLLRCSVGIVSVGATIAESLASAAPPVRSRIDAYVRAHVPFFSLQDRPNEEALASVMALQDGITRVEKATIGRRGGVGFMELIKAFGELGDSARPDRASVFTIVSGNTCIRVTGAYRTGRETSSGLRELWFNKQNSMDSPPDRDHITTLPVRFPGVILSACFTIDPEYLRKQTEQ